VSSVSLAYPHYAINKAERYNYPGYFALARLPTCNEGCEGHIQFLEAQVTYVFLTGGERPQWYQKAVCGGPGSLHILSIRLTYAVKESRRADSNR
jgi:hypothetical protein